MTVRIEDDAGTPISGAAVTVELFRNASSYAVETGTTGGTGEITFTFGNASSGTYVTDVIWVGGFVFDGSEPVNAFDKGTDVPPLFFGDCTS